MTWDDRQAAGCPDDELLTGYVEGRLVDAVRAAIEEHIAGCERCLDVVAACAVAPDAGTLVADPMRPRIYAHTSRPAERRRRWALAASILLVAGGLLLVAAERPLHALGAGLSGLASRWLGADVRVDAIALRVDGPGTFVVSLHDVHLGGTDDLFRADEVDVTIALAALASGNAPVRSIRLLRPVIEVARPDRLAVALSPDAGTRALATLGDLERVEVVDGRVVVRGTALGVDGVRGGLERDVDGAKLVLQGRSGVGIVAADGTLDSTTGHSALTITGQDVDAAMLPGVADGLTGTAVFRVAVAASAETIRIGGRVAVRGGRMAGRGPLRLLRLDPDLGAALVDAAPALGGDDLRFDEARAVFAWRNGTWRFSRVYLTAGDVVAGGRMRVEHGTVTGRGTVRIPAALAARLATRVPALASYRDAAGITLPFLLTGSVQSPRFALAAE